MVDALWFKGQKVDCGELAAKLSKSQHMAFPINRVDRGRERET